MKKIYYYSGYDYVLSTSAQFKTRILGQDVKTDFVRLSPDGTLNIAKYYAWNGANFFPDTATVMPASLVHDALIQLIQLGLLPGEFAGKAAEEFKLICLEDGMPSILADCVYEGLTVFGKDYCSKVRQEEVLTAP